MKKVIDCICSPIVLLAISLVIILFSLFAPWLFVGNWPTFFPFSKFGPITFSDKTGYIGDTFGIMNPIIAIAAAIITFAAFYMQWQANEKVNKQENHRQLNELSSQHWVLINSVKLYESEVQESFNFSIDSVNVEKATLIGKTHCKENILREGCEAFFTLYSQMYLHWVLNNFFDVMLTNEDSIEIDFAGACRTINRINKGDYVCLLISNRYNAEDIEGKILNKYIDVEVKRTISEKALIKLVTYYGYLFVHVFEHLFIALEQIDSNEILDEKEKLVKGKSFVGMLPVFEKVIVFLMFEFKIASFATKAKRDTLLPIMREYGFFDNLLIADFMMKEEFIRQKNVYISPRKTGRVIE